MAEKRKLRAGREPAAKRRVSEAVTPSQKKKASTPRVPSPPPPPPPPEPVEPLPISIKDGEPVPVLRERQPSDLSDKEYQSYAERFDRLNPRLVKRSTTNRGRLVILAQFSSLLLSDQRRSG
ncbi:hypothetical protein PDE_05618 [Penicillium oxalicum 114-2]|uniref:Uncharacterized protein n=1 Tax=Penicillium oxalicum (strain 114-2 / CGMCC 5302) TaxID=933388 RepID=S7ZPU4_PENO1|nr:hypothetical protein PDE_05618 [Penicillium oxalicum 114-2]